MDGINTNASAVNVGLPCMFSGTLLTVCIYCCCPDPLVKATPVSPPSPVAVKIGLLNTVPFSEDPRLPALTAILPPADSLSLYQTSGYCAAISFWKACEAAWHKSGTEQSPRVLEKCV